MFWIYPEKKYNQTKFTCYDAGEPSHFCKKGENWGAFTKDECNWIISLSNNVAVAKPQSYTVEDVNSNNHQVSSWEIYQTQKTNWLWQRLINNFVTANSRWWNYDIVGILEPLQLLCYDSTNSSGDCQDYYDLHIDNGYPFSCRKISFSVELSDPNSYEGAKLNLYLTEEPSILPKDRGTMIMFPSFILHEVTPIIQGKRWALVGWVSGPQFR
ncbi:MAG: 2OG-Fe(II) oxygenase [Microcoleaceae cyanobacterium MO_207.B10]|nr:2OG-Fe(II) oxygenase [Microcoleaceae cyanobacterium MO_207.B10]